MSTKAIPLTALERLVDAIISDDSLWSSKDDKQYSLRLAHIVLDVHKKLDYKLTEVVYSLDEALSFRHTRDREAVKNVLLEIYKEHNYELKGKIISTTAISALAKYLKKKRLRDSASWKIWNWIKEFLVKSKSTYEDYMDRELIDLKELEGAFAKGDLIPHLQAFFQRSGFRIEKHPNDDYQVAYLEDSMSAPFRGLSANALYEYLCQCQAKFQMGREHYAKFISVNNSSGTGKSRVLLQLRDHDVPVVYINLRSISDYNKFPPRDDDMAELFESESWADDFYVSCIMIFRALFQRLTTEFTRRMRDLNPDFDKQGSHLDFVKMVSKWNEEFTANVSEQNQQRNDFFNDVKDLYLELQRIYLSSNISLSRSLIEDYDALGKFLEKFMRDEHQHSPMLVLAFDDVQELTKPKGIDAFLPSLILGRVIKLYSTAGRYNPSIWVILASTNSKITQFAPPPPTAPAPFFASQRVLNDGVSLFPPFSSLQWDVFAKSTAELDIFCVGSYNDTISFGRPLWYSVRRAHSNPGAMRRFAAFKLCCGQDMKLDEARLAVLSQRFALGAVFGNRRAVPSVDNGIGAHMRVLLSSTDNHMWQYSSYPTEPVLSDAAAHLMYTGKDSLRQLLLCLNTEIDNGLIDGGMFGELISRLIILFSRDLAAIFAYNIPFEGKIPDLLPVAFHSPTFPSSPHHEYFQYLKPVPFLDVLNILFGYEWLSGHENGEEIKSTFGGAYISASHWVTMTRNVGLLPVGTTAKDWLKTLFLRGVAVQCHQDQPLIDKVIPILFLKGNEYDGMSCCLIQDKNCSRAIPLSLRLIDICDKSIGLKTDKPYVAICFNFGSRAKATSFTMSTKNDQKSLRVLSRGLDQKYMPVLGVREGIADQITALGETTQKIGQPGKSYEDEVQASLLYGLELSEEHIGVPQSKNARKLKARKAEQGKEGPTKKLKMDLD